MDDDLYNVIGPEFTVTFRGLTWEQHATLREALSENDDDLRAGIAGPFMTQLCSLVEGFIMSRKTVRERFAVEEEYPPGVSFDDREATIFCSINACYAEAHDELEDIFYSEMFEAFLKRESSALLVKLLKPALSWIDESSIEVEIDGLGES